MPRAPSRRRARHLFARWAEVAERLRSAKLVALFLDFDGTLVPIQPRPGDVRLDAATRRILSRLARQPRTKVWIVSGRRYADVRRRAKVAGAKHLGLHGWERGGRGPLPREPRRRLEKALHLLEQRVACFPGIWIEDKGLSLGVHYRRATAGAVRRARPLLRALVRPFAPDLHLLEGKKIWEVLAKEVKSKGTAVRAVLGELPRAALPIYVGDDTTDETAFAALRRGITVRVGIPRQTKARFYLRDPEEVKEFLEKLEAELP